MQNQGSINHVKSGIKLYKIRDQLITSNQGIDIANLGIKDQIRGQVSDQIILNHFKSGIKSCQIRKQLRDQITSNQGSNYVKPIRDKLI